MIRKRKSKLRREWEIFIRWLTGVVTVVSSLASIPQIAEVWSGSSGGVSITTWLMLGVDSFVWLGYGIVVSERMIIAENLFDVLTSIGVVLGGIKL